MPNGFKKMKDWIRAMIYEYDNGIGWLNSGMLSDADHIDFRLAERRRLDLDARPCAWIYGLLHRARSIASPSVRGGEKSFCAGHRGGAASLGKVTPESKAKANNGMENRETVEILRGMGRSK